MILTHLDSFVINDLSLLTYVQISTNAPAIHVEMVVLAHMESIILCVIARLDGLESRVKLISMSAPAPPVSMATARTPLTSISARVSLDGRATIATSVSYNLDFKARKLLENKHDLFDKMLAPTVFRNKNYFTVRLQICIRYYRFQCNFTYHSI